MKSAEAYILARDRAATHTEALCKLPQITLRCANRIPLSLHQPVQVCGLIILPIFRGNDLATSDEQFEATSDLALIRRWALDKPDWSVPLGAHVGQFALETIGVQGADALLRLCNDDWGWLDSLRIIDGEQRFILFSWAGMTGSQFARKRLARGVNLHGDGCSIRLDLRRLSAASTLYFINPTASILDPPKWLLQHAFVQAAIATKPVLNEGRMECSLEELRGRTA